VEKRISLLEFQPQPAVDQFPAGDNRLLYYAIISISFKLDTNAPALITLKIQASWSYVREYERACTSPLGNFRGSSKQQQELAWSVKRTRTDHSNLKFSLPD